jgi:hypothetical protein
MSCFNEFKAHGITKEMTWCAVGVLEKTCSRQCAGRSDALAQDTKGGTGSRACGPKLNAGSMGS